MKKHKSLFIGLFFIFSIVSSSFSQQYFSKKDLIEDLDILYKTIYEVHPDMFTVVSKKVFEKEIKKIKESFPDSMDRIGFYKAIAPLVSSLGDGHTTISLPFNDIINLNPYLFVNPFIIDKETLSLKVLKGGMLPEGAEIISINNKASTDIVEQMLSLVSGESNTFKVTRLNKFLSAYFYMIDDSENFIVKYVQNDEIHTREIQGMTLEDAKRKKKELELKNKKEPTKNQIKSAFNYSLLPDFNATLFQFDSFSFENGYMHTFLDSMFTDINKRNIKNLIIDIRNNGGGNSEVGDEIMQYISHQPFLQFGIVRVKVSDPVKAQYSYYKDWNNGIYNNIKESENLIKLKDIPIRFKGNVYLLTSNNTFSSAADFAWAFQYFDMGTIVGEETGGWIVTFGDVLPGQSLPHTGISYGVSWKEFYGYGATESDRHGVIPDVMVPSEQAMDKVLELIKTSR